MLPTGIVALCLALLCGAATAGDADAGEPAPALSSLPSAGGRLIWDSSEELDMLGDIWADLPFLSSRRQQLFAAVEARTSIEKTRSDFAFLVRDLDYTLRLGWRGRVRWLGRRPLSVFAGQRGKQRVDADGQPYARYLGVGLESRHYRGLLTGPPGLAGAEKLSWRVAAGPVFDEREVRGELVVRGDGRLHLFGPVQLELHVDALAGSGRFNADISGGPSFAIPVPGGRRAMLFAHYQRSRNPLGIGHSALLVGFEYLEGAADGLPRGSPPEIGGSLGAGAGEDGRLSGQFKLRVLSPGFHGLRVAFVVDANILTARDAGELYYFYHLGLERVVAGHVVGGYFYHRSNHQLAEPNDTVTSLNVVEVGLESAGWHRGGEPRAPMKRWGRIETRARVGWLIDSSFGEERRWHVRGGLRWRAPVLLALGPYVSAEIEAGDVERRAFAVGLAPADDLELQLEYRSDEQYFAGDRTAILLTARVHF